MFTLITAANSAEAYQLKGQLTSDKVLLGDYADLPEPLIRSGTMLALPNPSEPSYTHLMLSFCLDRNITVVYPLRPEEKKQLETAGQLFSEYGITIFC